MKKNELELFSKQELENISNIFNSNYNILKKNKTYKEQTNKIDTIHSKLSNILKNEEKRMFEEYDVMIWENREIELSLMYNLGIKKGIEIKDLTNTY